TTVGVVAESDENTLMRPLFSATNTRPSGEKRTAVGLARPLNATVSAKPAGTAADATASAGSAGLAGSNAPTSANAAMTRTDEDIRPPRGCRPVAVKQNLPRQRGR